MTRRVLPQRRASETFDLRFWNQNFTVTIGRFPDGVIAEVFIDGGKTGQDIQSTARDAAVVLSLALQHGTPIEAIRHAVTRSSSGEAASILGAVVDRLATVSVRDCRRPDMSAAAEADLLPKRRRGRQSDAAIIEYEEQVAGFCSLILQIKSTMDFDVGSRGWCYILERHGLRKGDFGAAEKLITDCRKSGALPLDICAEDESRRTVGLQAARRSGRRA